MKQKAENNTVLFKISVFIVKFRYVFFVIFLALTILSLFGTRLTKINNDITSYLPQESETRQALNIMSEEFTTQDTTEIMIKEVTLDEISTIVSDIESIEYVRSVSFDPKSDYRERNALITVTLELTENNEISQGVINDIRSYLENYDIALRGSTAKSVMFSEMMKDQMLVILLIALAVIIVVLVLTSKSFFEIPIFIVTFAVAALLNMGTNFIFGSISFITNSIAIVLQLALAIDYAIVFSHRYAEEVEKKEPREAVVSALAASIPSILASSLTTISGLIAIMFMQFRIGFDIGIVLTKGIFCSFITVFLLMPGLLCLFSGLLKKTRHRTYLPSVERPMKFVQKGRKIIPIVGLALVVAGCVGQSFTTYTYDSSIYPTNKMTSYNKGLKEIGEVFGEEQPLMGIIVDSGDYKSEYSLSKHIYDSYNTPTGGVVENVISLGYITQGIDPLSDLTYTQANALIMNIASYAYSSGMIDEDISGTDFTSTFQLVYMLYNLEINHSLDSSRPAPLFDREEQIGVLTYVLSTDNKLIQQSLDEETRSLIHTLNTAVPMIKSLLEGEHHSRIIMTLKAGTTAEDEKVYAMIEELRIHLKQSDDYEVAYVFGDAVSFYDIAQSFTGDRVLVNLLTIVFILIILLLSFRSLSLPVLLIMVIQGAIWINFAIYVIAATPMLFMSYLIVSAINMGATIDYAIVVTNRYRELRNQGVGKIISGHRALSSSFPAIMTSSTIMIIAGFIIGAISTEPYIFTIGFVLGSGTIISLLLVIFLLPSLLMDGDTLIQKTTLGGKRWREAETTAVVTAEQTLKESLQMREDPTDIQ